MSGDDKINENNDIITKETYNNSLLGDSGPSDKDLNKDGFRKDSDQNRMSILVFKRQNKNEERITSNLVKTLICLYVVLIALSFVIIFAVNKYFWIDATSPFNESYLQISLFSFRFVNYQNQNIKTETYNFNCVSADSNSCLNNCNFNIKLFEQYFDIYCSNFFRFKLSAIIVI